MKRREWLRSRPRLKLTYDQKPQLVWLRLVLDPEQYLLVIHAHAPRLALTDGLADVGVVHPAVARRAEDDEVFRPQALLGRALGQVKQVVGFTVSLTVAHHEARGFTELAGTPARALDVPGDGAGRSYNFNIR